ncbi:MAG: GNAT family N-acetyltransferase, partial [Candidatus Heimdallarchaeota archaeon]|nr:GNAT family N-acetyltransferase [Candidatus Heimdallarchaeota archaeon]
PIIRMGDESDAHKIKNFASRLSMDGEISKNKWLNKINQNNIYPLIAIVDNDIVGKVQARIIENIGWIESAKVDPKFRNQGIANSLVMKAISWLESQKVGQIRTMIDSDNLTARLIIEKLNFKTIHVTINPLAEINEADSSNPESNDLVSILDEESYNDYYKLVRKYNNGNLMFDGKIIPFSKVIFSILVSENRIFTDNNYSSILITSLHELPDEYYGCIISEDYTGYKKLGLALKSLAAREMASHAICYSPANKVAVKGLVSADYYWNHPHTTLVYQKLNGEYL